MATYNTGNPLGSADPRDLYDNAAGLDDAVNTQTSTTWTDRLGKIRLSWKGMEDAAATSVLAYDTKAQLDAAPGTKVGLMARVLNDANSVNNGLYIWTGTLWSKSANDPLMDQFKLLNSLTINRGKAFPFLRKVRAGKDYGPRQEFINCVLYMRVYGADPLYYYRLGIIANGNEGLGGPTGQGFRIEKCVKSNFETVGNSSTIHNNTSDIGLGLDYTVKGLQYRRFKMDLDPDVTVELVIDVDQLPAYGTAIAAVTDASAGYNWITDPVEYRTEKYPEETGSIDLSGIDSETINEDKDFPMVQVSRSGTASNWVHPTYKAAILDFHIQNAQEGYVYRLGNLQCALADTVTGELKYGFMLNRIPVSRLAEGYEQRIVNLDDGTELRFDYDKGGVQTLSVRATQFPDTILTVTADVDKLPRGVGITSNNSGAHGFNSIISTSRYEYMKPYQYREGDCLVDWDPATSKLKFGFKSGTKWYNWHFARKSINNTFTLLGYGFADAFSLWSDLMPVEYVSFTTRTEADSDWLAPFVFQAVNNGDPGVTEAKYSSGSHGTDGGGGGQSTAENILINIYVDGVLLDLSKPRKSVCKGVRMVFANRVLAWNTFVSRRWAAEEYFNLELGPGYCFVHKALKALEDIIITGDNGCQVYMAGMTPLTSSNYMMWGANQTARQVFANTPFDSGPKNQYPNVYGVSTRHPIAGEMTAWIDPKYGVGTREYLAPELAMLDFPRENGKMYFRLFAGAGGLTMAPGDTYQWRGGYFIGMPTKTDSFDTVQRVQDGIVFVKPNGSYVIS